jgi:hypothetical protein
MMSYGEDFKSRITYSALKIERESLARTMVTAMKAILEFYNCPNDWKGARTVLIYK